MRLLTRLFARPSFNHAGVYVCEGCRREVHQRSTGDYYHCELGVRSEWPAACEGSSLVFARRDGVIIGAACRKDAGVMDELSIADRMIVTPGEFRMGHSR